MSAPDMPRHPDRELQRVIEQALEDGRIRGLQDALLAVDLAAELDVTPAVVIGKLLEKAEGRVPSTEERTVNAKRYLERATVERDTRIESQCLDCDHPWAAHGPDGCRHALVGGRHCPCTEAGEQP